MPRSKTHLSLYYLAGYLVPTGVVLFGMLLTGTSSLLDRKKA